MTNVVTTWLVTLSGSNGLRTSQVVEAPDRDAACGKMESQWPGYRICKLLSVTLKRNPELADK